MNEKARQHVQSCANIHPDLLAQIHDLIPAEAGVMKHGMACLMISPKPAKAAHPPRRCESAALNAFDWKTVGKLREAREAGNQRWTHIETAPEAR
ncbi:hypothetical protein OESDEN_00355 [Oesophagostomum dentatum]|uniref:Uncharacterized protein n=1 Tax=Oesophagostomum dentatum TaxID=61180 RepID=A0A0B1TQ63_OESDE|nr:hypothetical protein OESDEN_00355 [Oesophagostomum dentatum]